MRGRPAGRTAIIAIAAFAMACIVFLSARTVRTVDPPITQRDDAGGDGHAGPEDEQVRGDERSGDQGVACTHGRPRMACRLEEMKSATAEVTRYCPCRPALMFLPSSLSMLPVQAGPHTGLATSAPRAHAAALCRHAGHRLVAGWPRAAGRAGLAAGRRGGGSRAAGRGLPGPFDRPQPFSRAVIARECRGSCRRSRRSFRSPRSSPAALPQYH